MKQLHASSLFCFSRLNIFSSACVSTGALYVWAINQRGNLCEGGVKRAVKLWSVSEAQRLLESATPFAMTCSTCCISIIRLSRTPNLFADLSHESFACEAPCRMKGCAASTGDMIVPLHHLFATTTRQRGTNDGEGPGYLEPSFPRSPPTWPRRLLSTGLLSDLVLTSISTGARIA